jgi:hypothetical protein
LPQGGPVVPYTIVADPEMVPSVPTLMRLAVLMPVHETGTSSLTGAGRATVGWPLSLLHWRIVPDAPGSKPEPVTFTTVPPFRHVPGSAVKLGGPATVVDFALHGIVVLVVVVACVVVVVVVAWVVEVVVGATVVVVVLPPPVVVVVVGGVPPPLNEIGTCTWGPFCVPRAITQLSPAVSWAGVGGHG